jgi:AcrR family transcriptional regulator
MVCSGNGSVGKASACVKIHCTLMSPQKRKYELRRRAEGMEATRRRIAEAALELHGSVGPARTSLSAVAERAGVQRHTLYRHFPTEEELFKACSGLFADENPLPDLERWRAIADPAERLAFGLGELYGWYEQTEPMLVNLYRDRALVEAVDRRMQRTDAYMEDAVRVLVAGFSARGGRRRVLGAAVRHAVGFETWRSLVREGGVSRAQAVALAGAMVEAAAGPRPTAAG